MAKDGMGALLLTDLYNILYATGLKDWCMTHGGPGVSFACIITMDEVVLSTPFAYRGNAEAYTWVKDIRNRSICASGPQSYIDVLQDVGKIRGTIGTELGKGMSFGMSVSEWESLKKGLPNTRFVDCCALMWRVRSVKSEGEIDRIRKACEIVTKAIPDAFSIIKEGITEREIARKIVISFMENGADRPYFFPIKAGENHPMADKFCVDRKLKKGDFVTLDIGPIYRDYCADVQRSACIGPPSAFQKKMNGYVKETIEACIEAFRPGVKISKIAEIRKKVQEEAGVYKMACYSKFVGHSLGLTVHEFPMLGFDTPGVFEPGMVFAVEPGLSPVRCNYTLPGFPKEGKFNIEDVVLITKDGHEVLGPSVPWGRDIFVV